MTRYEDAILDALNRETTKKAAAQATAWRACDLLAQWCELTIEEPHTPADAHLANLDRLLRTSRLFLDTAPTYVAGPGLGSGEGPRPGPVAAA